MKNNIFINKYVMACAIAIVITLVGFICMSTLPIEQYRTSHRLRYVSPRPTPEQTPTPS